MPQMTASTARRWIARSDSDGLLPEGSRPSGAALTRPMRRTEKPRANAAEGVVRRKARKAIAIAEPLIATTFVREQGSAEKPERWNQGKPAISGRRTPEPFASLPRAKLPTISLVRRDRRLRPSQGWPRA